MPFSFSKERLRPIKTWLTHIAFGGAKQGCGGREYCFQLTFNSSPSNRPIAVQGPVLNRFRHMVGLDIFFPREVGDGARDF